MHTRVGSTGWATQGDLPNIAPLRNLTTEASVGILLFYFWTTENFFYPILHLYDGNFEIC